LRFKEGVSPDQLTKEGLWAAVVADRVHYTLTGTSAVITETNGSKHRVPNSAHYRGDAVDIRIWYTDGENSTDEFVEAMQDELGEHYDVILEKDHIHVEWDPIYKGDS